MRQIGIRIVERSGAVLFLGLIAMLFCMTYLRYGLWCYPIDIAAVVGSASARDMIRQHRRKLDEARKKTGRQHVARKRRNGWVVLFQIVATFVAGIFLLYRWASGNLAHYWYPTVLAVVAVITSWLWIPDLETVVKKRRGAGFDLDRLGTLAMFLAWGGGAALLCLWLTGNLAHYWYVSVPVAVATAAGIVVAPDIENPVT
ncbi:MAG: hypothetical protein ACLQKA_20745 [Bryobacteraceae bacterium]